MSKEYDFVYERVKNHQENVTQHPFQCNYSKQLKRLSEFHFYKSQHCHFSHRNALTRKGFIFVIASNLLLLKGSKRFNCGGSKFTDGFIPIICIPHLSVLLMKYQEVEFKKFGGVKSGHILSPRTWPKAVTGLTGESVSLRAKDGLKKVS